MTRFYVAALAMVILALGLDSSVRADDKDAGPILDKAIKALGGEAALGKAKAFTWKSKGTVSFGGNENVFTGQSTAQGIDHFRSEFEGEFNGEKTHGIVVLGGDKAWRKFRGDIQELNEERTANEKRNVYLQLVPVTLLPLKGKDFKVEAIGDEKVGDKPASRLKVTGPDGKEFILFFDKESGLPVKQTAHVIGFGNNEFDQETTFSEYKDFDGIKKATKTESLRDGQQFLTLEISEFKILNDVPPDTFSAPH